MHHRSGAPSRALALLALVVALLGWPSSSDAQERYQDPFVRAVAARAATGAHVRLTWPDRLRTHGRLVEIGTADIAVQPVSGPAVRVSGDSGVIVHRRTSGAAKGALIGGVILGGLGGLAGAAVGSLGGAECDCNEPVVGAFVGTVVVGAIGAGVGALIGSAVPRWVRIAPMPTPH